MRTLATLVATFAIACTSAPLVMPPVTPTPSSSPTETTASPSASGRPSATQPRIPLPTFVEISAPSRDVVWAFVGGIALFLSRDRGDTWDERPLPPGGKVDSMSFVSEREGWILQAGSAATGCMAQSAVIWHTADGGSSYQGLPQDTVPPGIAVPAGVAAARCKSAIAFTDARQGFLTTWGRDTSPVIYRTNDGGRSWARSQAVPDPPGFTTVPAGPTLRPGRVHAFDDTLLLPVEGQRVDRGALFVFRSTNGGETWEYAVETPLPSSLAFITAGRWLQLSSARETLDGGFSWRPFATGYSQAAPVPPSVVFADAEIGYATVRGAIQRTVDGGRGWAALRTPGT